MGEYQGRDVVAWLPLHGYKDAPCIPYVPHMWNMCNPTVISALNYNVLRQRTCSMHTNMLHADTHAPCMHSCSMQTNMLQA